MLLFRTDAMKAAAKQMTESYQAAGFYDLRLKLSVNGRFEHINEYLYSEVELDNRKTGESSSIMLIRATAPHKLRWKQWQPIT